MRMQIHAMHADGAVTLWWEKPEQASGKETFTVTYGDTQLQTDTTHCTLKELPEETVCRFSVFMGDELLGETTVKTGKRLRKISVTDFGAVGDGKTMNTQALQKAIDACGPDACVMIPEGVYLTGALRLHSDMALCVGKGAVLMGSEAPEDYLPKIHSRFEGTEMECYQSLLNLGTLDHTAGPNCENVLIYGEGEICGGGQPLGLRIIEAERERLRSYIESLGEKVKEYENNNTIPGRARGRLINLSNCSHVRITGLTLKNGASWNVHMIYSDHIVTDHCFFQSSGVWNGDGWDPDSSTDCTLFASRFCTGDDSVAIKSGKNPEGNVIARPTKHIRIFDCFSEGGLGIAVGSEMSGGVEDVRIWDCDLVHSLYGVQIKATRKRGGYVRDIFVSDSCLSRFLICAVKYNDDGVGSDKPPVFENLGCRRVHFSGWARDYWEKEDHEVACIECTGFDEPGYEAKHLRFEACTAERGVQPVLVHCLDVKADVMPSGARVE